jgi:AcrR family transcriptional regulator
MSREDRRAMIVRSVLPLVAEYGRDLTSRQIARAAGIGEGTIFRVFTDKEELFGACVAEAVRIDGVLAALDDIPLDLPIADRLAEAAASLDAQFERVGAVLTALARPRGRPGAAPSADADPDADPGEDCGGDPADDGRRQAFGALHDAVVRLLEPDRDALRLPPERVATLFMTLVTGRAGGPTGPLPSAPLDSADLIDTLLNGVLRPDPPGAPLEGTPS